MTAPTTAAPAAAALVPRPSPRDDPRTRGRLDISPTAVESIVVGAARSVPGVRAVSRKIGADRLSVEARVLGAVASVTIELAVAYPSPVRDTCRALRAVVVQEVGRLAGVEVTRLDLQVAELQPSGAATRRVR